MDKPAHPVSAPGSWWAVLALGALAVATTLRPPRGGVAAAPRGGRTGPAEGTAGVKDTGGGAVAEPGRGRQAGSPVAIPAAGWKDIAWRSYQGIGDDRLLAVAAGVTFYALLALFPAIASIVSLYALFADPATLSDRLAALAGVLPGGAIDIVGEQIKRISASSSGSLSVALVISLAVSLWSANAGMKAVFDALNVAYREKEKRSFVALNLQSLAFTVGAIVLLLLALAAVVVLPLMFNLIGFGGALGWVLTIARWPLLLVVVTLALSVLYRYGPSRRRAKWRWIGWGSGLAALLWIVASMLFSFYVSKFGSYNATYGSLGSAVGFMTWLWISAIIVLVGAEVAGEMEHQTARDTTKGPEKPRGNRGAVMADEIGAAWK